MSPADAARLVLSGDDGWTLLAEDPAYDTRYGAAVRVLAQHVLDDDTSPATAATLLTIPTEPDEGTCVEIVGGSNDGQVWERVNTGLTPDATAQWKLRRGVSGSEWARWSGLWLRLTEDDGDGQVGIRVVPTPFFLGQKVKGPDELDAGAVLGLIVVDRFGNVGAYVSPSDDQDSTWAIAGLDGHAKAADLSFPVTVRFVPTSGVT